MFLDKSRNIMERDIDHNTAADDPRRQLRLKDFLGGSRFLNLLDDLTKVIENAPANLSLGDVIKTMVKTEAYIRYKLSLDEFVDAFERFALAERVVTVFIKSLELEEVGQMDCDNDVIEFEVANRINWFLSKFNLTGAETLSEFVASQRDDFPGVFISKIFGDDIGGVRSRLVAIINSQVKRLAAEAYNEKFREDSSGFVMGFLMSRVIRGDLDSRQTTFDEAQFLKLMKYLDDIGANIDMIAGESLYSALYNESRGMSRYAMGRKVDVLRFGFNNAVRGVSDVDLEEDNGLFHSPNFNVQAFYSAYIKPALYRFYTAKQSAVSPVREPDLLFMLNAPDNHGARNFTRQMLRHISSLRNTAKFDPVAFWQKIGEMLGLSCRMVEGDLNEADLRQHVEFCLEKTEEKFRYILEEALSYRGDATSQQKLAYPAELLACRDLHDLLEWVVSPGSFKQSYPVYKSMSDAQISFAAAAFLRDFLRVSKKINDSDFLQAVTDRDLLEKVLIRRVLEVSDIAVNVDVPFRLLEELGADGQVLSERRFQVAVNLPVVLADFESQFNKELERFMSEPDGAVVQFNGLSYRIHPIENKVFKLVNMRVPVMSRGISDNGVGSGFERVAKRGIKALVYTGDQHYIHVKNDLARLVSEDRGKEVTDHLRWMLSFSSNEDLNLFKEWLYSSNIRAFLKVDDGIEGRHISCKAVNGSVRDRSEKSRRFKKKQALALVKCFNIVVEEKLRDGKKVSITRAIPLETQCHGLASLLISNLSDYSDTAHALYRAERVWSLLFSLYFDPAYWGDEYQKLQIEGFQYPKKD